MGPTLSAWASRDFKLLVTIFSSSSRSPHLLHPKQGRQEWGSGARGQERGRSRKNRHREQERKRENKLRKEKTQCRWTKSRATASRSCQDASVHPLLVLPCMDTLCITTSQALIGPAREAGMEGWRSVPGLHLLERE